MQMLPFFAHRAPALAGTLLLAIATGLAGCASKNPLIDEPAAVKSTTDAPKTAATPVVAPVKTAAAIPAKPAVEESGVQKTDSRLFGMLRPYRVDVQQGNFVTKEMVSQLKPGMTSDQVRFVLGTPLLTDLFHSNRWDYVFRLQKGTGEVLSSHVTVFFKDNRLSRFDGGNLPTEQDYLALIAGNQPLPKKVLNADPHPMPPSSATPTK